MERQNIKSKDDAFRSSIKYSNSHSNWYDQKTVSIKKEIS